MDYHKDRFEDYSLMCYNFDELVAVFPANVSKSVMYSHRGLTYGGLVMKSDFYLKEAEQIMDALLKFIKQKDINTVIIKPIPEFYTSKSSRQLEHVLKRKYTDIVQKNRVLALNYNSDFRIYKSKLKRYRKFDSGHFQIKSETKQFDIFWRELLEPRLQEKYKTSPVHKLNEILQLHNAFPDQIEQYNLFKEELLLAGITIFKTKKVVKSQYGMASKLGEKLGALDMLFVHLIKRFEKEEFQYFSMGSVNDDSEKGYNEGMLKQKQEFGCEVYIQPIYQLKLNG